MFLLMAGVEISFEKSRKKKNQCFLKKSLLRVFSFFAKISMCLKNCVLFDCIFFPCIGCFSLAIIKKKQACFKKTMREAFLWKEIQENADGNA